MLKALLLVADGSEEIEFVTPYDVLTRAGFDEVKSVGVQLAYEGHARMSRNLRIIPDAPTLMTIGWQSAHENFDILILPGGAPGAKTFSQNDDVLQMIRNFRQAGKWVAAICAGTTALVASQERFGPAEKAIVTSHPSVKKDVEDAGWNYSEEAVVVDGKVITSRGPGTALLFALTIVEQLCGKKKRDDVAGPMIVA